MATWRVEGRANDTGAFVGLYLTSRDAKSMKRADLDAAVREAARKAAERWKREGINATVVRAECVG